MNTSNFSLKVRAWDEVNQCMVYPTENYFDMGMSNGDILDRCKTVMLSSGVKDVEGNFIYAGDLVDRWYSQPTPEMYISEVVWKDCGLTFLPQTGFTLCDNSDGKFRIVGNIYQNPELRISTDSVIE